MRNIKLFFLWAIIGAAVCDLPPGTRRNTYLPPEPTKGYNYDKPGVTFPKPTPGFPPGNTRPNPPFPPPGGNRPPTPGPRPPPIRPSPGPGPLPTPGGGGDHDHGAHEPGMPFDFNYAVKEDAYGNDYSHNAISDGDVVRGEYRVQMPDGRLQVVRYTADWKHGFSAQVSYEGTPRFDVPRPGGGGGPPSSPGAFAGY
ncbi:pro-resilin isoform X2 [Prorops nasuta]|uniref:pro-resilin isoform X2 n=1 Tax=Prorops nasuta TaxID=863751 RepID=UPI0034CF1B73